MLVFYYRYSSVAFVKVNTFLCTYWQFSKLSLALSSLYMLRDELYSSECDLTHVISFPSILLTIDINHWSATPECLIQHLFQTCQCVLTNFHALPCVGNRWLIREIWNWNIWPETVKNRATPKTKLKKLATDSFSGHFYGMHWL